MNTSLPKLLITGGQGQIAQALCRHPQAAQWHLFALGHAELDITQPNVITNVIEAIKPQAVINTAAYTAVDKAESEHAIALNINQEGTKYLAMACESLGIPLIHLSTDYVFSGKKTSPYTETDSPDPINYYGHSKYLGEEAVRAHCQQHVILRVSSVFSRHGTNFVKTILRLASERENLQIVADQISCPTAADDIATALFTIANRLSTFGTYHYCSQQPISWHQFAIAIVTAAKATRPLCVKTIQPISATDYITAAKRPLYSVLACDKIARDYALSPPDWQSALRILVS